MKRALMNIIGHTKIAKDTYRLLLKGDIVHDIKAPGQFVHIQVDERFYLRRPVSISDMDVKEETIMLLYKVMGKGTDALTTKKVGEDLDVLGPGGSGFPAQNLGIRHALLVGGGIGVPPLYNLAKQLKADGVEVTSVLGFQSAEDTFLTEAFAEFGDVHITTNDGSLGTKGFVTDVLPSVEESCDMYFTCGPTVMLKAVKKQLDHKPGYISMEERMGCGIGACFACVVEANDEKGYRRICCDGPVFDAKEVVLS
ncbi:dihydroorotate dehydrogenase electron transfer subunit [Halobacillus sp. ACCC02827]|uniref:dihydroorotate dehydrogenase electron transfer subunit n=1 Tax=Halobacillus sp. ACCC02827 TaxID=3052090 RepID=UPI0025705A54|nr:dihydroorotate dehydrogenase electron transfer subunit [Halobacillus sp. ACCC02827]WJE17399.1 dihydroorotate dehydrogenase electron transfer subunit [Halobacillus sp. ACCC02827]